VKIPGLLSHVTTHQIRVSHSQDQPALAPATECGIVTEHICDAVDSESAISGIQQSQNLATFYGTQKPHSTQDTLGNNPPRHYYQTNLQNLRSYGFIRCPACRITNRVYIKPFAGQKNERPDLYTHTLPSPFAPLHCLLFVLYKASKTL
jgi:hypothetical protein